jgi:hypothetical protein
LSRVEYTAPVCVIGLTSVSVFILILQEAACTCICNPGWPGFFWITSLLYNTDAIFEGLKKARGGCMAGLDFYQAQSTLNCCAIVSGKLQGVSTTSFRVLHEGYLPFPSQSKTEEVRAKYETVCGKAGQRISWLPPKGKGKL